MRAFLVMAGLVLVVGCTPDVPTGSNDPVQLTVVGTPPTGTPGWLLDDALAVRVTDAAGRPMANVEVAWQALADGAQLENLTPGPAPTGVSYAPFNRYWLETSVSRTGADGVAKVRYMPGWANGGQQVVASANGLSAAITVPVAGMSLHSVAIALDRACGLDGDGKLYCWVPRWPARGNPPEAIPAKIRPVAAKTSERFSAVTGGGVWAVHTQMCALTIAGDVRCFGDADFDAAGAVTPVALSSPVRFTAIMGSTFGLSGTDRGWLCGLDASGQAWCEGQNGAGQLGDGTTVSRSTFAPVAGAQRFSNLVMGAWQACGLDSGGIPWCWGEGANVGGATLGERNVRVPTRVTERPFAALAAAGGTWCGAASTSRTFQCLSSPTFPQAEQTIGVTDHPSVRAVSSGDGYGNFAIMNDGRIGSYGFQANFDIMLPGLVFDAELDHFDGFVAGAPGATCAAHTTGSTICLNALFRPVGVPLP